MEGRGWKEREGWNMGEGRRKLRVKEGVWRRIRVKEGRREEERREDGRKLRMKEGIGRIG